MKNALHTPALSDTWIPLRRGLWMTIGWIEGRGIITLCDAPTWAARSGDFWQWETEIHFRADRWTWIKSWGLVRALTRALPERPFFVGAKDLQSLGIEIIPGPRTRCRVVMYPQEDGQ